MGKKFSKMYKLVPQVCQIGKNGPEIYNLKESDKVDLGDSRLVKNGP